MKKKIILFAAAFLATHLVLGATGTTFTVLIGDSMEPAYHTGDIILCSSNVEPEVGDVVVYDRGDKMISHRVVGEIHGEYLVKGDNNEKLDPYSFEEQDFKCVFVYSLKPGTLIHNLYK
jgi:signal peptidase I